MIKLLVIYLILGVVMLIVDSLYRKGNYARTAKDMNENPLGVEFKGLSMVLVYVLGYLLFWPASVYGHYLRIRNG